MLSRALVDGVLGKCTLRECCCGWWHGCVCTWHRLGTVWEQPPCVLGRLSRESAAQHPQELFWHFEGTWELCQLSSWLSLGISWLC